MKIGVSRNVLGKIGTSKNNELPTTRKLMRALLGLGAIGIALNEIRGLVMAAPVLVALYQSGGTLMAWWVGLCSLGGIALSALMPIVIFRKVSGNG